MSVSRWGYEIFYFELQIQTNIGPKINFRSRQKNKSPTSVQRTDFNLHHILYQLQGVDKFVKLAFCVACFVFVDDSFRSHAIHVGLHFNKKLAS